MSRDVVFYKSSCWNWEVPHNNAPEIEAEGIPEDPVNISHSTSNFESSAREASDNVRLYSPSPIKDSTHSQVASINEYPPRRTKLLTDVYNACMFALHVGYLVDYRETVKSKQW